MAADFYSILDNFKNFIGGRTGLLHWVLFCAAVVAIFFLGKKYKEEKQAVRFLVWPSVLVLLFIFNPLFYRYVGSRFFAGVYWRLFWMLPISFSVAYVMQMEKTGSACGSLCGGTCYDHGQWTKDLQRKDLYRGRK